jgi:photosystem II stability/assembly factor-like uncharacterized protein
MAPIYDVSIKGYGTGFDLSLAGARGYQRVHGGTVMVSRDGGQTWKPLDDDPKEESHGDAG